MFLYRFTELSVEPEKPRFLWDRDSARSAKRIRWVTRSDAISCGGYRVRLGAPLLRNKCLRDGAPRCVLWRCFQRHALSETLCGWRYAQALVMHHYKQPLQHGFFCLDKHRIVPG